MPKERNERNAPYRRGLTEAERDQKARYRSEFNTVRDAYWIDYGVKARAERDAKGPPSTSGKNVLRDYDIYPEYQQNKKTGKVENNFQRMADGRPPLGADGRPVELHHQKSLKAHVIDESAGKTSVQSPNESENLIPLRKDFHNLFKRELHQEQYKQAESHDEKMSLREKCMRQRARGTMRP